MQWPFRKLDARTVQLAMQAPAQEAAGPQGPAPNHSNFSQDAARWLIDYRDLQVKRDIGSGAFGSVKLATWNETEVAVKLLTSLEQLGVTDIASVIGADGKVNLTGPAGEAMKTLEREVSLMMGMRHPNVILFLGVTTNPPAVVTEYCSRGSLYDLLKEAHDNETLARQLDWPRRLTIALDAAKGMLYLHSHKPPIIHRDLKSPNLLIDRHWRAKVTDFNLSRLSEAPSVASSVVANNPRWSAPEIVTSHQFSTAGDVFAFGHILWELLTWELPFAAMKPFQMIVYIGSQGGRPEIPPPGSPLIRGGTFPGYDDYLALMRACWAENPADRPAFDQVIASLRAIAGKMAEEARGQAQASAAAAAALQAAAADEPEQQQAPEPSFAPVATNNAEATNGGGGGGGGGAIPPPVLSPFDMPTAGAAGGPPPPMRSPFDDLSLIHI